MKDEDEEWRRYFDEENNAFYFYNEKIGESKWETSESGIDSSISDSNELSNSVINNYLIEESTEKENDFEKDNSSMPFLRNSVFDYPKYQFNLDVPFILLNGIFLEAPLCIIEGILRCAVDILIIFYEVLQILFGGRSKILYASIEDLIFTSMVLLTITVPGTICLIYRNFIFRGSNLEWNIAPLPTLIGYTDMRRFSVITFGYAGYAINAQTLSASSRQDCVWEWIPYHYKRETMILVPIEIYRSVNEYMQSID